MSWPKVAKILKRLEDALLVAVFAVLAGTVFLQFFTRYVLGSAFGWTEEIARILLIVTLYIGAAIAVRDRANIKIAFLHHYLPARLSRALKTLTALACLAFYAYASWTAARMALLSNRKLLSVEMSFSVIIWIVAASFAVMALHQLVNLIRAWRAGADPLFDPETTGGEA